MRIIKQGQVPGDKVYQGKCTNCRTEVEFTKKEATPIDDRRDSLLRVNCPTCDYGIFVNE